MSKAGSIYLTMAGTLFLPAIAYFTLTQMQYTTVKPDKNMQIFVMIIAVALGAVISANLTYGDEED